jgi:hypothetical protein
MLLRFARWRTAKKLGSFIRRHRPPSLEAAPCSFERATEVALRRMRQGTECLAGSRVDHRLFDASIRREPNAVDQQRKLIVLCHGTTLSSRNRLVDPLRLWCYLNIDRAIATGACNLVIFV